MHTKTVWPRGRWIYKREADDMKCFGSNSFSRTPGACRTSPSVPIQINPWAGLLPEQGLCPLEGSPSRGFISSRRLFRGFGSRSLYLSRGYAPGGFVEQGIHFVATLPSEAGFQVSPYSNRPVGGVPCSIAARPPTVGRVRHTAKGPYGLPLAPAWVVSRPTRPPCP